MAWKMNIGGIDIEPVVPDVIVEHIKEQLQQLGDPAKGIWLLLNNQDSEGAIQVYLTPSTPLVLTRAANDPTELLYEFEHGAHPLRNGPLLLRDEGAILHFRDPTKTSAR